MKELQTGIRYVKVGHSEIVQYFSQESINLYDPERAGWVRDEGSDYSAPEDVVNFMKKEPVETIKEQIQNFDTVTTRELKDMLPKLTIEELHYIRDNDKRKTAVKYVEEEIAKR